MIATKPESSNPNEVPWLDDGQNREELCIALACIMEVLDQELSVNGISAAEILSVGLARLGVGLALNALNSQAVLDDENVASWLGPISLFTAKSTVPFLKRAGGGAKQ